MDLADAGDERLDDRVVRLAAQPRMAPADVQRVVEQRLAVRADVERHGQRQRRVDARRRRVEGELADRDAHPAGALVAEAEDALVVGDDDEPDLVARGVAQDLGHAVDVVGRDPDAARAAVEVAELLAGTPHGGRVDDREQLLEVVPEHAVEQGLVAVLERRQADVPLEVVGLVADVLQLEADLLVDVHDARRQEAAQAERVALLVGERGVLVEHRVGEQGEAAQEDRRRSGPDRRASRTGRDRRCACPRGVDGAEAAPMRVTAPRTTVALRASRRARRRCPGGRERRSRPRDPMTIVS